MKTLPMTLVNARTKCAVADVVEVALTRRARRKGLLGRSQLTPFSALVLAPCASIHTMFMQVAIDVLFLDADGRVLRIVPDLGPWRAALSLFAHAVIELPAGTLQSRDVTVGDGLYLTPDGSDRLSLRAADLRERLC